LGISLKKIDNDRLNNAKLASFDEIDKVLEINEKIRIEEQREAEHGNRIMLFKVLPVVLIIAIILYSVLEILYGDKSRLVDAVYIFIGYIGGLFTNKISKPKDR
jgi:hypothetical protein